jgi:dihydropyrimidinase
MADKYDLLFKNGLLVTGQGIQKADLAVTGEKIALIASDIPVDTAGSVQDLSGKYLLPGVIDVHVHPVYLDDVEDCSRIAAYSGTTTLIHYAYARKGESLLEQVELMLEDASRRSLLDFSLHGGLFDSPIQVPEIVKVMELGIRTYKFFLTYLKQGWYTDDYQLIKAMDILAERDGMAMVHAENGGGIDYLEDKYLKGPNASAKFFNTSRPAAFEEEAIFRSICLAEVTGCPLYIPHVTSERALRPIQRAQEQGLQVYGETCPQYLTLTEEIIEKRGALAKIGPPIRKQSDQDALWAALRSGVLQVVASDHAPKAKDVNGDFLEQGFGAPQIETLLPMTFRGGINLGKVSLVRLVQILSENPARIFGLYPQKGTLEVGTDADMIILDPNREFTIHQENQHSNVGYTLFEGYSVIGWPERTYQRGALVMDNDQVVAAPGKGQFLPTSPAKIPPLSP